ncbi:MAG TPA: hypothetical protein VK498_09090 [Ferruginibacter sp.]|nr:hypothetical protein [Ferruginibacter sp.]
MEVNKKYLLEKFDRPVRVLFGRDDKSYQRLFWFNYDEKNEFYIGSSLNPIISSGKGDVQYLLQLQDGSYRAKVDTASVQNEYHSLKFSFHSTGVRHLKMTNSKTNEREELYREKYYKLEDLKSPEMLFAMVSKRISFYQDYKKNVTQGNTNAVLLNTPPEYLNYRQIFEFYICNNHELTMPYFIIQKETSFDYLTFKLKNNLFLYVRFTINAADNGLNRNYPDREILVFKDNGILKTFSFK